MKEYIATTAHEATKSYELDAATGDRFFAYKSSDHGVLKAQLVKTQEVGYIPVHIVTDR